MVSTFNMYDPNLVTIITSVSTFSKMVDPHRQVDSPIPFMATPVTNHYCGYIYMVNYNDLTATSLESWLVREMIPKWP